MESGHATYQDSLFFFISTELFHLNMSYFPYFTAEIKAQKSNSLNEF